MAQDLNMDSKLAHLDADTDTAITAIHHTLGPGTTQASPGSHIHDGKDSHRIKASNLDLDIEITGPKGDTGDPGPKGDTGDTGPKGDTGDPGASYTPGDPVYVIVRNNTGSTLLKGTVVYTNGATGGKVTVAPALATGDSTSARTLGWVADDIATNAEGLVQIEGHLVGVNTASYTDGSIVYLSGTTAGAWTTTKPVAPTHMVYLGVIAKAASAAGGGAVMVKVQNGYELDELHDVLITSKTNGDLLQYESSTNLWKNKAQSTLNIAPSQVTGTAVVTGDSRLSDARTPLSHTHGNISNTGTITTSVTATNPVKVLITDSSNVAGTLTTTGASNTTFLRGDGTWSTPAGGGSSVPFSLRYIKTGYSYGPIVPGTYTSSSLPVNNTLYATPIYVPATTTITSISLYVNTLAGTTGQYAMAIYNNSSTDDYPTTKVTGSDSAVLTGTTFGVTGWNVNTISVSLTAGLYWIAVVRQATTAPTVLCLSSGPSGSTVMPFAGTLGTTSPAIAWQQTGVTGTLPTTFTATKSAVSGTVPVAVIGA